jgi:hypothetical protein
MAFDQPLDADRVEGNLLLALVRGPILGSLMWILGDDEVERRRQEKQLQRGLQDMVLDGTDEGDDRNAAQCSNEMTLPRLVRSDLSTTMDSSGREQQPVYNWYQEAPFFPSRGASSSDSSGSITRRTEKKRMSWSDNLVEYMDEVRRRLSLCLCAVCAWLV